MGRCAQLVMGPAGAGKSTYCNVMREHFESSKRSAKIINLDPAAEEFAYPVAVDVRDLVSLEDVMDDEELRMGPNGGLIFCMEYLAANLDWLRDQLDSFDEDEYFVFDLPGQSELFTHFSTMRRVVDALKSWDIRVCGVYLLDSVFISDAPRFISGSLVAMSCMIQLEVPHINVLSKCDLVDKSTINRFLLPTSAEVLPLLRSSLDRRFVRLNEAISSLLDDYSMVGFVPLDATDEDSISELVLQIDAAVQYGEDLEPREPAFDEGDAADGPTAATLFT